MSPKLLAPLLGLSVVFFAACSSPTARIERNPDLFAKLSAEQQSLVKKGQIGYGFTKEMVLLALGKPEKIETFTDTGSKMEAWYYFDYKFRSEMQSTSDPRTPDTFEETKPYKPIASVAQVKSAVPNRYHNEVKEVSDKKVLVHVRFNSQGRVCWFDQQRIR